MNTSSTLDDSAAPSTTEHARAESQLVISCLTTIFAGIWVSVHPNVPGLQDSFFKKLWARIRLMLLALVTPESVIEFALRQYSVAMRIYNGT
jgi:hypothetical protein